MKFFWHSQAGQIIRQIDRSMSGNEFRDLSSSRLGETCTEKSVVVTAKLIFVTVKRLAGNERVNEGMSLNQPK